MSYNPADDEDKLREIIDAEWLDDIELPPRWARCLAERILEQNATICQYSLGAGRSQQEFLLRRSRRRQQGASLRLRRAPNKIEYM